MSYLLHAPVIEQGGGEYTVPYDEAEKSALTGSREVPEEVLDYYLCERLGINMTQLNGMPVELVFGQLAYQRGKDIAAGVDHGR